MLEAFFAIAFLAVCIVCVIIGATMKEEPGDAWIL